MATVIKSSDKGFFTTKEIGERNRQLLYGKLSNYGVDILHTTLNIGECSPLHFHKKDIETFYILKGKFELQISTKTDIDKLDTIIAEPGDFVISPQFTWRSFKALINGSEILIISSPSNEYKFITDLQKSRFGETGQLNKKYLKLFDEKHGIVIGQPPLKSKL